MVADLGVAGPVPVGLRQRGDSTKSLKFYAVSTDALFYASLTIFTDCRIEFLQAASTVVVDTKGAGASHAFVGGKKNSMKTAGTGLLPARAISFAHITGSGAAAQILLVAGLALNLSAHHSGSAYDQTKSIEWKGTVTEFQFVNPHAYVFFTMQDASGKQVKARCELQASMALSRLGWTKEMFTPGMKLTLKGAPGRNEENVCVLRSFIKEDGREIGTREDLTKSGANPMATLAKNAPRPERLANGHPNLQGPWIGLGGPGAGGQGGDGKKGPGPGAAGKKGGPGGRGGPQPSEAGVLAAKNYDQPFDDPAIKCDPANILFGYGHDRHVNFITQSDNEITIKYGYMDLVRTIHTNMTEHPKNVAASRAGHSIGKWDGDTLVVDTTHLAAGVLMPINGVQFSDQMHIVERFTFDPAAKTLTRVYTAEDPLYLKAPYTGQDVQMISDEPYVPYNCVELSGKNNIRTNK